MKTSLIPVVIREIGQSEMIPWRPGLKEIQKKILFTITSQNFRRALPI